MKYVEAIREATAIKMKDDENVLICGLGVPDVKGVFGSTMGLVEEFGVKRVFDTPVSENGTLGMLVGASFHGLRPIMVNQRVDFVLLALDQLINHASKWKKMFGGVQKAPVTIRLIVGRGWGQGPQHSQSMQGLFSYIPGIKVLAPATPSDAKGLLISAIEDDDPVVFIEHRRLYDQEEDVPDGIIRVPIGKANVVCEGTDVTIVTSSQMVVESKKAVDALVEKGVSPELIDLRTLRPLDKETVIKSVKKTGRLLVVDGDWADCSVSSEVIASVAENDVGCLKASPVRLTWPDMPCPTSEQLEPFFYPSAQEIYETCIKLLNKEKDAVVIKKEEQVFKGPF